MFPFYPNTSQSYQMNSSAGTDVIIGSINGMFQGPYPLNENLCRKITALTALSNEAYVAGTERGEIFLLQKGLATVALGVLTGITSSDPGVRDCSQHITAVSVLPNGNLIFSTTRGVVHEFSHPLIQQHLNLSSQRLMGPRP